MRFFYLSIPFLRDDAGVLLHELFCDSLLKSCRSAYRAVKTVLPPRPLAILLLGAALTSVGQNLSAQGDDTQSRKGICGESTEDPLLEQICSLNGGSQKLSGQFLTGFLPGGSIAQLVIDRKFKAAENIEFQGLMIWTNRSPSVMPKVLRILSVEAQSVTGKTVLTVEVPGVEGASPYRNARFMVAAYDEGKAPPSKGAAPLYVVERVGTVSSKWFSSVASIVLVLTLYCASAKWYGKWSPVAITAGAMGRGSASKLQIFFFSFVVIWLLAYILSRTGELSALSPDVLMLLGISAAGTAGAKATAVARNRLSMENWAWLVSKKLIDAEPVHSEARWADLMISDGEFDVSKFQMLAFNLVIAAALLMSSLTELSTFTIPANLLGVLGLSQVVYLGGKVVPANPIADLGRLTDEARGLESVFMEAVAETWQESPPERRTPAELRDIGTAKGDALAKYSAYMKSAEAVVETAKRTFNRTAPTTYDIQPDYPE